MMGLVDGNVVLTSGEALQQKDVASDFGVVTRADPPRLKSGTDVDVLIFTDNDDYVIAATFALGRRLRRFELGPSRWILVGSSLSCGQASTLGWHPHPMVTRTLVAGARFSDPGLLKRNPNALQRSEPQ